MERTRTNDSFGMSKVSSQITTNVTTTPTNHDSVDGLISNQDNEISPPPNINDATPQIQYRTYRRRFIGLAQLVLLNIVVSWDWLTFAAVSSTSATYFGVPETSINWLSTGFLFAFIVVSPLVIHTLHTCLLYTSPSPRDGLLSRMPSSA